jgi:hypothetical protein
MPDLPKVIPILEYVAGVTSSTAPRASGAARREHSVRERPIFLSVPGTIDMPTHTPGDNTIDPGGAPLPFT